MRASSRKPGAVRRREIAEAALAVLGDGGLTALTTAAVARRLELTPAALFRHFASLEEVLSAAVELGAGRLAESLPSEELPPRERVERLVRGRVALLVSQPGVAWLLRSETARRHLAPEALETVRAQMRGTRAFLLAALREGAAAGSVRTDASPRALLTIVTGTIQSIVGACGGAREPGDGDEPLADELIDALLRVIAAPTDAGACGARRERNGASAESGSAPRS